MSGSRPIFYPCWFDGTYDGNGLFCIERHNLETAPATRGLGSPEAPGRWRWEGVGILDSDGDYTMHGSWTRLPPVDAAPQAPAPPDLDTLPCPACVTVPMTITAYAATADDPAAWHATCPACGYDGEGTGDAPTLRRMIDGADTDNRWNDVNIGAWTRAIVAAVRASA